MKTRILIVDDSMVSSHMLKTILENEHYETFVIHSGKEVMDAIEKHGIDIILLDVVMPEIDGYQVLEMLINNDNTRHIPVIIITDLSGAGEVKKALDAGAMDFVRKSSEPIEIIARIHSAVKLKTKHDQLLRSAERDPLTQLYNKQYFNLMLEKMMKVRGDYHKGAALLMIDCDHFKAVNDNYGHTFGDEVLISVSNTIAKSIKLHDTACRYGGEEFCALLPNTTPFQAFATAERIRKNIEKVTFEVRGSQIKVTASIGVGHTKSDDGKHGIQLVNEADTALYKAKKEGRNRTVVFDEVTTANVI